jgi:hypothetical protein
MHHTNKRRFRFGWLVAVLLFWGAGTVSYAQEAYTSGDNNFGFKLPKRWKVEATGATIHLTSPDGSKFLVQRDVLAALPSGPPAYDAGIKAEAARMAARLLPKAELIRAQTAVVDHGSGAVFRFQEKSKTDDAPVVAVWVAVIGRHSVVIVPEKAAQAGEAIGLSTIVQSAAFADSLPPPARVPPTGRVPVPGGASAVGQGNVSTGPRTVSFQTQIAPILRQRCRACHNGDSALGGLNVVSFTAFVKGGDHGALVMPGKPANSPLMDYLTGRRDRMPKGSDPLPAEQIALFRTWIQEGATDDSATGTADPKMDPAVSPTAPARRRRLSRPNANAPEPAGAAPVEAYAGHLIASDTGFTLRLLRDGSATADWSFSTTVSAHFLGSYRGKDGTYAVALTLASGSTPYAAKTLALDIRPHGEAEIGRFGLDTDQPRRDIAGLSLSQVDVNFKKGGAIKGGAVRRGKNGRLK